MNLCEVCGKSSYLVYCSGRWLCKECLDRSLRGLRMKEIFIIMTLAFMAGCATLTVETPSGVKAKYNTVFKEVKVGVFEIEKVSETNYRVILKDGSSSTAEVVRELVPVLESAVKIGATVK